MSNTVSSRTVLKSYFETGDRPSQSQFDDLITTIPALAAVPATPTSAGEAGTIAYDGTYLYVCVATDTWRRTAVASW